MSNKLKNFLNFSNDGILTPTVVLTSICLTVTLALSITNMFTEKKIKDLSAKNERTAMTKILKADGYEKQTVRSDGEEYSYYTAYSKDKKILGYIVTVDTKGYGGTVSVMTAISTDMTVKNVRILDVSNETPGLGQNTANKNFTSQFKDKSFGITVVKSSADSKKNEINAVTGATISSKAVTKAVNKALNIITSEQDGGNDEE